MRYKVPYFVGYWYKSIDWHILQASEGSHYTLWRGHLKALCRWPTERDLLRPMESEGGVMIGSCSFISLLCSYAWGGIKGLQGASSLGAMPCVPFQCTLKTFSNPWFPQLCPFFTGCGTIISCLFFMLFLFPLACSYETSIKYAYHEFIMYHLFAARLASAIAKCLKAFLCVSVALLSHQLFPVTLLCQRTQFWTQRAAQEAKCAGCQDLFSFFFLSCFYMASLGESHSHWYWRASFDSQAKCDLMQFWPLASVSSTMQPETKHPIIAGYFTAAMPAVSFCVQEMEA